MTSFLIDEWNYLDNNNNNDSDNDNNSDSSDNNSDDDESDKDKKTIVATKEMIKIGKTKAYHDLLLLASQKNDLQLVTFLFSIIKSKHFDLLEINKYFKINFEIGNYEICEYLIKSERFPRSENIYSRMSWFEYIRHITFKNKNQFIALMELYFCNCPVKSQTFNFDFISSLEKILNTNFEDTDDKRNWIVETIIKMYLNVGLFKNCDKFSIFTFDYLCKNYGDQLTVKSVLEFIDLLSYQPTSESLTINLNNLLKFSTVDFTVSENYEKLKTIIRNLTTKNNILFIKLLFENCKTNKQQNNDFLHAIINNLDKNYVAYNQLWTELFINLLENYIDPVELPNIIKCLSNKISGNTFLSVYQKGIELCKKCNAKINFMECFSELEGKNNHLIIKELFDFYSFESESSNTEETNKIIINILKKEGNNNNAIELFDYLLQKIDMSNEIFNEIMGNYYASSRYKTGNNQFGMIYFLKKYNTNADINIVVPNKLFCCGSYYGYGSSSYSTSYSFSYSNGDPPKVIFENLTKLNNNELLELFFNKCHFEINAEMIKSVINAKNVLLLQLILTRINLSNDQSNLVNAKDILKLYCSQDSFLEETKKIFIFDNSEHAFIFDLFEIALTNQAMLTVQFLYSKCSNVNLSSFENKLFLTCCKTNKLESCIFLKKVCPWYALIIRNKKIVYYDCNLLEYILEQIDLDNYFDLLKILKIKHNESNIDYECIICKDTHTNILKLNCNHHVCLKSLCDFFVQNPQKSMQCCYCKTSIKFEECENYLNNLNIDEIIAETIPENKL